MCGLAVEFLDGVLFVFSGEVLGLGLECVDFVLLVGDLAAEFLEFLGSPGDLSLGGLFAAGCSWVVPGDFSVGGVVDFDGVAVGAALVLVA